METVKIANSASPSGYTIINASDFDKSKHVLFGAEKPATAPKAKPAPKTATKAKAASQKA